MLTTPILTEELSREVLKSYTFNELKTILKELRKHQKKALASSDRDSYFRIYDNVQKVTFKMRNIIRQRKNLKSKISISKEF